MPTIATAETAATALMLNAIFDTPFRPPSTRPTLTLKHMRLRTIWHLRCQFRVLSYPLLGPRAEPAPGRTRDGGCDIPRRLYSYATGQ